METFFASYLEVLHTLHHEFIATFEGLPQEALDWVPGQDMNSLCVLVVHTNGATRFWTGDVALGEPSNRNRDAEFQARGLNEEALKGYFKVTEDYLRGALERLTTNDLAVVHTVPGRGREVTAAWALLHALEHVGVHTGHAQITRQLWDQRVGRG